MYKYLLFTIIVLFGCKNKEQTFTINEISITGSSKYTFKRVKGIDSYISYLISPNNDTIHIEYGREGIIDGLYQKSPPVFSNKTKAKIIASSKEPITDDAVVFSDYPQQDYEKRIFDKNYYMYDTINGIIAQLVKPKRQNEGIVGIYIPQLKSGNSLSIYMKNTTEQKAEEAYKIYKTIRYK